VLSQRTAKNTEQVRWQIAGFRGLDRESRKSRTPMDRVKLDKPMHCAAGFDCNIGPADLPVIAAASGMQDAAVSGEAIRHH
jgi:hypothetical protein